MGADPRLSVLPSPVRPRAATLASVLEPGRSKTPPEALVTWLPWAVPTLSLAVVEAGRLSL